MLGWVLQRGLQAATGAPEALPDDTQIEQPDTPGPTFAARALKTAIFGTPVPVEHHHRPLESSDDAANKAKARPATASDTGSKTPSKSPARPQGILLTPGTGTSRRKRVSFGHDVPASADGQDKTSGASKQESGEGPRGAQTAEEEGEKETRPRTKLTEALERSRRSTTKASNAEEARKKEAERQGQTTDDGWEEVDDDLDQDPDMTVDLNEPHSRSGRYWKAEFESYHGDAMVQMEKLVKHRHLAKSYAKMKDAEATELGQMLREEKQKVVRMEGRIAELAGQTALKKVSGADTDADAYADTDTDQDKEHRQEMMAKLAKQTALAVQYREQVQELETLLLGGGEDQQGGTSEARKRRGRVASPRTHKTLLDTQRELRRAREQVKELNDVRNELQRVRSDLRAAERKGLKLDLDNNKTMAGDLSRSESKVQDLQGRLEKAREDGRRKDEELRMLRKEFDKIKDNAKARIGEAQEVFQQKDDRILKLEEELRSLKLGSSGRSGEAARFIDLTDSDPRWASSELRRLEKSSAEVGRAARSSMHGRERARTRSGEGGKTPSQPQSQIDDECHPLSDFTIQADKLHQRIDSLDEDSLAPGTPTAKPQPVVSRPLGLGKRNAAGALKDRANRHQPPNEEMQDRQSSVSTAARRYERAGLAAVSAQDSRRNPGHLRSQASLDNNHHRTSRDTLDRIRAQTTLRPGTSESEAPQFDLAQGKFARLGGPEMNESVMNASKSTLPPERRMAALARLQQKRADRKRSHDVYNKENIRP